MLKVLVGTVAIALIAMGCSSGKSVDGKWNVKSSSLPAGSTMDATFSSPDKVAIAMIMPQELPGGKKMTITADVTGTYKIEGEFMTLKADSVKMNVKDAPAELKGLLEGEIKKQETLTKDKLNEEGKTKFAWVDDNTFTLTGKSGSPETFTRAK